MKVGHGFEELLLEVVIYMMAAAAIFIFIQLVAYTTITLRNHSRRRSVKRRFPSWKRSLESYISTGRGEKLNLDEGETNGFRDMLINYYCGNPMDDSEEEPRRLNSAQRRRIRILYREKGFLEDDIRHIRSGPWWSKVTALGRLALLEINDAEDLSVELVESGNVEVVKSCVHYLSVIHSRFLPEIIDSAYQKVDDRGIEELNVSIAGASNDAEDLRKLVMSESGKSRMSAAKILGRKGLPKTTHFLKKLLTDPDKDIRYQAVRSLGKVGNMKAVWALEKALEDPDPGIRSMAKKEIRKVREDIQVTSIWDMEMDDRTQKSLINKFSDESVMGF